MTGEGPAIHVEIEGRARVFPIPPEGVCRIGRSPDNSIVITEGGVSRLHAMIHRDAGNRCKLSDAGSSNGTTLKGRPVNKSLPLKDGDKIGIGTHVLIYRCGQPLTEPTSAEDTTAVTMFTTKQRLITVLVIDIEGFTRLSQELGEDRISRLMMSFFQGCGAILEQRDAWAQKYIGDAVMAVWTHKGDQVANDEFANILAAIGEFTRLAETLSAANALPRPLRFGSGINTGYAAIGNMGSAALTDFTALGDTVNKAFRLEAASRDLKRDIVIGRGTIDYLVHPIPPGRQPDATEVALRGYAEPAAVFVVDGAQLTRLQYHVANAHAVQRTMITR